MKIDKLFVINKYGLNIFVLSDSNYKKRLFQLTAVSINIYSPAAKMAIIIRNLATPTTSVLKHVIYQNVHTGL